MKVILLENISKIGKKHDVINVSDGYAINFLIPNKKAVFADKDGVGKIEKEKAEELKQKQKKENLLLKKIKELKSLDVEIKERANDQGHLFAGISKDELAEKIKEQTKLEINAEDINLSKPLKEVGDYDIEVSVLDKKVKFKIKVVAL